MSTRGAMRVAERCAFVLGLLAPAMAFSCRHSGGDGQEEGVVIIPLEATAASGAIYRLVGSFHVTGPTDLTISTEDYLGTSAITKPLVTGIYSIALADGWEAP